MPCSWSQSTAGSERDREEERDQDPRQHLPRDEEHLEQRADANDDPEHDEHRPHGKPDRPLGDHRPSIAPPSDGLGIGRVAGVSTAILHTSEGEIHVELLDEQAPETVGNFTKLAGEGFYDGLGFHRVIEDFMIQGGCPRGDGTGDPGYKFDDEQSALELPVDRGALAMANSGPNTNGSQFFIVTADECSWLNGKHAVFGRVTDGHGRRRRDLPRRHRRSRRAGRRR